MKKSWNQYLMIDKARANFELGEEWDHGSECKSADLQRRSHDVQHTGERNAGVSATSSAMPSVTTAATCTGLVQEMQLCRANSSDQRRLALKAAHGRTNMEGEGEWLSQMEDVFERLRGESGYIDTVEFGWLFRSQFGATDEVRYVRGKKSIFFVVVHHKRERAFTSEWFSFSGGELSCSLAI